MGTHTAKTFLPHLIAGIIFVIFCIFLVHHRDPMVFTNPTNWGIAAGSSLVVVSALHLISARLHKFDLEHPDMN